MVISNIISAIEQFAPAALQQQWDNSGLQLGDRCAECTGVMVCVDVTPAVVAEAAEKGCNLIVSHHPLLFRSLKHITGATPVEQVVVEAIRRDIAIYSAHTSLDSCRGGVSYAMAEMLGARVVDVLDPLADRMLTLTAYVPRDLASEVEISLLDVASGEPVAVQTDAESSTVDTTAQADGIPVFGIDHKPLRAITLNVASWQRRAVESALADLAGVHEGITWQFAPSTATPSGIGLGVVAEFDTPVTPAELVGRVKQAFSSPVVRASRPDPAPELIRRMAMCGGAGGEYVGEALRRGAQAYLTSDTRYHDFVDFGASLLMLDIGHFESEECTKRLIFETIRKKFPNFAVYYAESSTNPINYL